MRKGKTVKRVLIILIVLILGASAAFYIGLQTMLRSFSEEVSGIEISDIDLNGVDDGVYTGEYYLNDSVGAAVNVTVKDGKIASIDLVEHKCGRGKKAEVITEAVIDKQSLNVDAVSGATGSSKVILKAIENALRQGISK